jgi:hypothetical protein
MSAFVLMKLILGATFGTGGHASASPQYSVIHGYRITFWESVLFVQFLSLLRVSRSAASG